MRPLHSDTGNRTMAKSAAFSPIPQARNTRIDFTVPRIAKEAAKVSKRHIAQFTNIAALARTIQSYIPPGKVLQKDFADLTNALIDCADFYRDRAVAEEVAFSLVATDTLYLLDPDLRADILRHGNAERKSSTVKCATARTR